MKINFNCKIVNNRHKRILLTYYDTSRQQQEQEIFSLQEAKLVVKELKEAIKELTHYINTSNSIDSFFDFNKKFGGLI